MSRSIRFSIAGLMGAVLIVAVGLAALRSASEMWAGVIFLSTCGVLALAIVGIFCRREAERAWWLGFALFGWGYLLTCGLLGLAMLGAALAEGRPRQIWLGAALFGIGYMILAFGRDPIPHPTPSLPTDRFLSALRPWFPRMPEGFFTSSKVEAANARILKALEEPISMSFPKETPLEDVLKYIRQATERPDRKGIPIYVAPIGLQEAERSMNSTVTVNLHDVPLGSTLNACLKQLDLGYGIRDGFLVVTSIESVPPPYEDPFLMGGHCVMALVAAAVGGVLAPLVAAARARRSRLSV